MKAAAPRVVEKFYAPDELATMIGFNARFWRDAIKAGPVLRDEQGAVIAECVEISGKFFAPASWVNAFLAHHAVQYDAGIRARNKSDLERKLRRAAESPVALPAAA